MEGCAAPLHEWLPYFACGKYTGLGLSLMFDGPSFRYVSHRHGIQFVNFQQLPSAW